MASPKGELANMGNSGNNEGMLTAITNLVSVISQAPESETTSEVSSNVDESTPRKPTASEKAVKQKFKNIFVFLFQ